MMFRIFPIILLAMLSSLKVTARITQSPDALHRAQQALTDIIVHDIFSPPVASRIYVYANIAAYELYSKTGKTQSLRAGIPALPDLSGIKLPKNFNPDLSAVYAFLLTAKGFVFSEHRMQDSIEAILSTYRNLIKDTNQINNSLRVGRQVSDSILRWSSLDNYRQTRSLRRYSFKKSEGHWLPTPPAYMAAIEPNWNRMRCLVLDSASQFKPLPPVTYNMDTSSIFYHRAMEVYNTGKSLTAEQRDIALFWDCNPFFVNTSGHLVFATKKLSPGGHWISIAGIASREKGLDAVRSSMAYTLVAIALYDGFISCWDEKYRSNYIRPETIINSRIDESWRPLLQTPPFPEYTSGHSVISTAASVVLTRLFGNDVPLIDSTETAFGLPVRQFKSFQHAAEEASISRLYGGIHFSDAITEGQIQGKKIGNHLLNKLSILIPEKITQ